MSEEKKRAIRKAVNKLADDELDTLFWFMVVEGLI